MMATHRYTIRPANLGAHLFEVTLTVAEPQADGQVFTVPAWIPGSYMVRDYARHYVSVRAECDGEPVELVKLDKSRWQAAPCTAPLTLIAEVYALDLSVRGAHLDTTHAYFNGTCVFPMVEGQETVSCEVDIRPPPPPHGKGWRVATSMEPVDAETYGYGRYRADDYAELIDHPVEIGELAIGEFEAGGIPHVIAVRGHERFDMARLCHDLSTLCATHITFLGPPADLDRYCFLLNVVNDGYGGLEHRWSSSLVCGRGDLPKRGESGVSATYRKLLGLCSHEYFHLWNVKRMKPAAFKPFDLQSEAYTGLLWVFEGITSYYDDLVLLRSGLITRESYLELLGQVVTRVQRGHGRTLQSVEDSSFEAWTKFYKQDANAVNAIVSYYAKGSLIALALDLHLRHGTDGRVALDDVVRECWRRYGETGEGMPERGLESAAAELSGMELGDFFARYVRGTADLPLAQLLREQGVDLHWRAARGRGDSGGKPAGSDAPPPPWLGARLTDNEGRPTVSVVHAGGPAEQAGLSPGDELLALNGLRVRTDAWDAQLRDCAPGDHAQLTVFRRDELLTFRVTLVKAPETTAYLTLREDDDGHRAEWLAIPS